MLEKSLFQNKCLVRYGDRILVAQIGEVNLKRYSVHSNYPDSFCSGIREKVFSKRYSTTVSPNFLVCLPSEETVTTAYFTDTDQV